MRLQTRIFAVSFTVSSILLVVSALATFALAAGRDQGDAAATRAAMHAITLAMAQQNEDSQAIADLKAMVRSTLIPVRRDVAGRSILAEDRTIRSIALVAAMVLVGALAAFIISTIAAAGMTARWRRIGAGIDSLLAGDRTIRFSGPGTSRNAEFAGLERALDSLLDAMAESSRIAAEFRALQSWGEAAAYLAHQAKTPLATIALSAASIRASVAALPDTAAGSTAIAGAAARIENESARIASFLARLGALSGLGELALAPVDPAEVAMAAASLLMPRYRSIQKTAIDITVSGNGPLPLLDAGYLCEAFINLLANTSEACAERQIPFAATIVVHRAATVCTIGYSDSITGLPAEIVSKVGSRRFTTKANGSGLGIWLVGRIVALHGGQLRIRRTVPGGLGFTMNFPLRGG